MVFSSLTFVCVFLPVVYILYWMLPFVKLQNMLLIVASLVFYAYGEPDFIIMMLLSVLFNYVCAYLIDNTKKYARKAILALDIVVNLGFLGYFKYMTLLVETVNKIIGSKWDVPDILLPMGISFFTFQIMSYVIDVYKGVYPAEKNITKVLLYISFFPQLIAGPIVKYHDIAPYLSERHKDAKQSSQGFRRFCYGLGKKVLISNAMGLVVDEIYQMKQVNAALAWIGAIGYMLQIYYDFSGYSDMAIGMGKMFGFSYAENFQYPYSADSIKEFWRRWHISLSSWFKEYLYIPLGGNRKGRLRTSINKICVFFCTGLWHGANWTFVVWGLYHGAFLMLEEYIKLPKNKFLKIWKHLYTCVVVCVGFVIFRSDTLKQAGYMIKNMATGFYTTTELTGKVQHLLSPQFLWMLAIGIIMAMPIRNIVKRALEKMGEKWTNIGEIFSYMGALLLLVMCLFNLAGNNYNPFIYFRF